MKYDLSVTERSDEAIYRIIAHTLRTRDKRAWLFQQGVNRANGQKEVEKLARFYHADSQYTLDDVPSRYPMQMAYSKTITCKAFRSHPTCIHEVYAVKATRTTAVERLLPGKTLQKHSSKVFSVAKFVMKHAIQKGVRLVVPGGSEMGRLLSTMNQGNKASEMYSNANTLARVIRFVDDKLGNLDKETKKIWKLWDDIDKAVIFYVHIITPYQIAENKGDDADEKPFNIARFSGKSFVHIEALKPFKEDFANAIERGMRSSDTIDFMKGEVMRSAALSYGYGVNFHLQNQNVGDEQLDATINFGSDYKMFEAGNWQPMES